MQPKGRKWISARPRAPLTSPANYDKLCHYAGIWRYFQITYALHFDRRFDYKQVFTPFIIATTKKGSSMISRNAVRWAACAVALGSISSLSLRSSAQGSPFTIRRPPDGSTVRETVRIQIPRSSIGPKSFVVVYIDGKFDVALDPERGQDPSMTEDAATPNGNTDSRFFTYVWNTKANHVSDGQHSVRAVLFDPAPGGAEGLGVTQRATSEVKVNVANKITDGPSSLSLRYKYPEGRNIEYARSSKSVRGGGGVLTSNTDQDLASINSKLLLGILSSSDLSLVRNKLTALSILSGGQEQTFPTNQLSGSMYQELDSRGQVHYETGSTTGLAEFTAQGLPVDNTLELPVLPQASVSVGQTWTTPAQRIDVPGLPPVLQPKVKLQNTLVDLEWEGNYRTAKIHQHADDVKLPGDFEFGQIPVLSSTATFDRDVYIAYTSGTLVKMTRTLTIKGRTSVQPLDSGSPAGGGGMFGGSAMGGGMMGGGGAMGRPSSSGMMAGGGGAMMGRPGSGGMMGGSGGGMRPGSGGGMMGRPGSGGMMGGGAMMGRPGSGGMMAGGKGGPAGDEGGGRMGGGLIPGGGGPSGFGGAAAGQPDYPVTLKAITDTRLLRITSA